MQLYRCLKSSLGFHMFHEGKCTLIKLFIRTLKLYDKIRPIEKDKIYNLCSTTQHPYGFKMRLHR